MMKKVELNNGAVTVELGSNTVKVIGRNDEVLFDLDNVESRKKENVKPFFFFMGRHEREKVAKWLTVTIPTTHNQVEFCRRVEVALQNVEYDFQIATMEPSFGVDGQLTFAKNKDVAVGLNYWQWLEKASSFYNDEFWQSDLAEIAEYDLFIAYRIATGCWTIEYVCDDSSGRGNYRRGELDGCHMEKTGARRVGGFHDGVGNTHKLVKAGDSFVVCGGNYRALGSQYPVGDVGSWVYFACEFVGYASGVVVIRKKVKD